MMAIFPSAQSLPGVGYALVEKIAKILKWSRGSYGSRRVFKILKGVVFATAQRGVILLSPV